MSRRWRSAAKVLHGTLRAANDVSRIASRAQKERLLPGTRRREARDKKAKRVQCEERRGKDRLAVAVAVAGQDWVKESKAEKASVPGRGWKAGVVESDSDGCKTLEGWQLKECVLHLLVVNGEIHVMVGSHRVPGERRFMGFNFRSCIYLFAPIHHSTHPTLFGAESHVWDSAAGGRRLVVSGESRPRRIL